MKNPTHSFKETNLALKNRKLKVKLQWVAKEKRGFVPFVFPEGNFFNNCVLPQCIVYWIYFQNIHTLTYQKTLLRTLLWLVFKIIDSLRCILKKGTWRMKVYYVVPLTYRLTGHSEIFKIKLYHLQEILSLRCNIILKLLSPFHICF